MIQEQIINKILSTKDASLITLNALTDEFFSNYSEEFNFIKNHVEQYGKVPDLPTFVSKFEKFPIIAVDETDSYLIKELFNDRNKRQLAKTFNTVKDLVENGKTEDAISLYMQSSEKLITGISLNSFDLIQNKDRYDQYVERSKDYTKFYVSTGFKELDNLLGGWDREEDYITISARPGVGKSWILLKCVTAAAEQGLRVGLYSGEMSEKMVGYRFDTLVSNISNGSMIHGNENIMTDYKKYIDSLDSRFKGTIKVLTPSMIGGLAGVSALRAFIEKDKLDILFIDQHSLLDDDRKAKNPVERAGNISKDIRVLQSIKHIPIITVSQQNREKNDTGTPGTENLSQSDKIGQDSSVVIFLEKKDNILTLFLAKSRFGVSGAKLQYNVDLNRGLFTYIPNENDVNADDSEAISNRYITQESTGKDVF